LGGPEGPIAGKGVGYRAAHLEELVADGPAGPEQLAEHTAIAIATTPLEPPCSLGHHPEKAGPRELARVSTMAQRLAHLWGVDARQPHPEPGAVPAHVKRIAVEYPQDGHRQVRGWGPLPREGE